MEWEGVGGDGGEANMIVEGKLIWICNTWSTKFAPLPRKLTNSFAHLHWSSMFEAYVAMRVLGREINLDL